MAEKERKWISIMIVPEDGSGVRKWRISDRRFFFFKASFVVTCVFVFFGLASMISLGFMYFRLKEYKQYNAQLLDATSKLTVIASRLERYEERESKLRIIIGGDFELPVAMNSDDVYPETRLADGLTHEKTDELGNLLKRQEKRMRMVPSIWPVNGWQISKHFKNTGNKRLDHYGIDIIAPKKSNVFATADGRIISAGFDDMLGLLVVINHGDNGWVTKYGHNETLLVREGELVRKGQRIAIYGGTDNSSTGKHLHYEVLYKGKPVNPLENGLKEKPWMKIVQR